MRRAPPVMRAVPRVSPVACELIGSSIAEPPNQRSVHHSRTVQLGGARTEILNHNAAHLGKNLIRLNPNGSRLGRKASSGDRSVRSRPPTYGVARQVRRPKPLDRIP